MNRFSIAAVLAAATGLAAGTVSAQDWTGGYIGLSAGGNTTHHHGDGIAFDTNLDGNYGDTVPNGSGGDAFSAGACSGNAQGRMPSDGCTKNKHKANVGLRAGYDWRMNDIVYGVVGEVDSVKIEDSVSAFSSEPNAYTFSRKVKTLSALRGRVGYASNDWLTYATAGFVWADVRHEFATTNNLNTFTAGDSKSHGGYQVGLGVEKSMGDAWRVGLEYLHTSLRDPSPVVRAGPSPSTFASNLFLATNPQGTDMKRGSDRFRNDSVLVTVTYRFGAR
ncbi:outer membrane protein [Asticcacaulis solisilvae]|uniref:outer membrane protein n=1 Tax=Asticcacaulis solisilvae TaxID=1217274 RepID=UPI003FD86725